MDNGSNKLLYIKKGGTFYPVGCLTSNSFSESVDMIPSTTRENVNGWTSSVPTTQSYSISFDGLITYDDRGQTVITFRDIQALKRGRTLIEWKIESSSGGDTDHGKGYITEIGDQSNIDEFISFSAQIQGFGEPEIIAGVTPPQPGLDDFIPYYETAKID